MACHDHDVVYYDHNEAMLWEQQCMPWPGNDVVYCGYDVDMLSERQSNNKLFWGITD